VSRSLVLTYSYLSGIHCNWPTSLSVQRVIRLLPASVCFANKSAQREWRPDSPTKTPRRGTYFVRPVCVYGEPGLALSEPCHLARSVYRLRSRSRVAPIHLLSKPDSAPSLLPRHTPIEDPHGHGRRSSLTYYALMASRVGMYLPSNSFQRPRSIVRGSHIDPPLRYTAREGRTSRRQTNRCSAVSAWALVTTPTFS